MNHKFTMLPVSLVALFAFSLFAFTSPVVAQSKSKAAASEKESSTKKSTKKASSARTTKKDEPKSKVQKELAETSGRLPNFFGQLELKDDQILEIYQLQNEYQKEIDALQKKIADLKAKMKSEAEKVLTTRQKSSLKKLRGDTTSRSSTSKKSTKSKK